MKGTFFGLSCNVNANEINNMFPFHLSGSNNNDDDANGEVGLISL